MKEDKGITLIALVITIIVMLILVGVSVTVAIQGGLFKSAKNAVNNTKNALNEENKLSSGTVNIDNNEINNIEEWATNLSTN